MKYNILCPASRIRMSGRAWRSIWATTWWSWRTSPTWPNWRSASAPSMRRTSTRGSPPESWVCPHVDWDSAQSPSFSFRISKSTERHRGLIHFTPHINIWNIKWRFEIHLLIPTTNFTTDYWNLKRTFCKLKNVDINIKEYLARIPTFRQFKLLSQHLTMINITNLKFKCEARRQIPPFNSTILSEYVIIKSYSYF